MENQRERRKLVETLMQAHNLSREEAEAAAAIELGEVGGDTLPLDDPDEETR